ncbi:MAG: hypothetical protein M1830_009708 [Pleopsidium flavum]|nr:MAG: hypothetical protein M1830_009708 [Pleopsidium flavum]
MVDITAIINLLVNAIGTANTAVHSWTTYWWNVRQAKLAEELSEWKARVVKMEAMEKAYGQQLLDYQARIADLELRLECLRAADLSLVGFDPTAEDE